MPIDGAARKSVKLLKKGTLKVIPGAPHGMCTTLADQINNELLAFVADDRSPALVPPARRHQGYISEHRQSCCVTPTPLRLRRERVVPCRRSA